jgi:hypothetical protein
MTVSTEELGGPGSPDQEGPAAEAQAPTPERAPLPRREPGEALDRLNAQQSQRADQARQAVEASAAPAEAPAVADAGKAPQRRPMRREEILGAASQKSQPGNPGVVQSPPWEPAERPADPVVPASGESNRHEIATHNQAPLGHRLKRAFGRVFKPYWGTRGKPPES